VEDFKTAAKKIVESEPDIQHWTFGQYVIVILFWLVPFMHFSPSLQRQADGTFKDEDLAQILHNALVLPD
jgi:linoleate 10R-lipoxygenase